MSRISVTLYIVYNHTTIYYTLTKKGKHHTGIIHYNSVYYIHMCKPHLLNNMFYFIFTLRLVFRSYIIIYIDVIKIYLLTSYTMNFQPKVGPIRSTRIIYIYTCTHLINLKKIWVINSNNKHVYDFFRHIEFITFTFIL